MDPSTNKTDHATISLSWKLKLKPSPGDESEHTTVFRTHDITSDHFKFELRFELGRENFALSGTTVDTSRSRHAQG